MVAWLLRREFPSVQCYCFNAPPVFSQNLAHECVGFVRSVTNGVCRDRAGCLTDDRRWPRCACVFVQRCVLSEGPVTMRLTVVTLDRVMLLRRRVCARR